MIDQFLKNLHVSPSAAVFAIERNGLLIGASTDQPTHTLTIQNNQAQLRQLPATASNDTLIQATTQHLYSSFNHLTHVNSKQHLRFSSQGEQNFVSISPFGDQYGLDWLIMDMRPPKRLKRGRNRLLSQPLKL
ncbi:MAG: hypothetical protein MJA27_04105 [Pseudanabaenales cyanobacterium]|nr:hypothetical protein [Pseudanabaenales cyanobacterium]